MYHHHAGVHFIYDYYYSTFFFSIHIHIILYFVQIYLPFREQKKHKLALIKCSQMCGKMKIYMHKINGWDAVAYLSHSIWTVSISLCVVGFFVAFLFRLNKYCVTDTILMHSSQHRETGHSDGDHPQNGCVIWTFKIVSYIIIIRK